MPKGLTVEDDILKQCWDDNDDGAGYMFAANGKLCIRKPFFKFDELLDSYKRDSAKYGDESAFVIHFRWATHGGRTELNTHPHSLCGGRVGMVHNGIFADTPPSTSAISDTVYFCRTVLAKRQPSQLLGRRFREYLEDMIGFNKIVMMDFEGKISIVNAVMGDWIDGVWFSNLNFCQPIRTWVPVSSGWQPIKHTLPLPPCTPEATRPEEISDEEAAKGELEEESLEAWREYETQREQIEAWGEATTRTRTSTVINEIVYPIGG